MTDTQTPTYHHFHAKTSVLFSTKEKDLCTHAASLSWQCLLILQASKLRNLILTVKTQRSGFKWRFNLVTERVVKEIHTAGVCSACKELNYRRKLCFLMSNSHPTVILVWLWCIRCMWLHLRPHFVFKCWCILFRVFFSRYLLCFTTSARVCHVLIKGTFMMLLLVDVKTIIHLSHF